MTLNQIIDNHAYILMEGAVVERLRRTDGITLDPSLSNTPLIYSAKARKELNHIYSSYIKVAEKANVPFFMCAPTWKANYERVNLSKYKRTINQDALAFMLKIKAQFPRLIIKIGGMMGPKNDCYQPKEGLNIEESEQFHTWQANQLKQGAADYIIAQTLPNTNEALGVAKAIAKTGLPYFISFVIGSDGKILDGTPLEEAIRLIDSKTNTPPLGYFVNCAYPSFIESSTPNITLTERLIGILANASSLNHDELDGSASLKMEPIEDWGLQMLKLNNNLNVKILGGCCGTNTEHLNYLVENM